MRSCMGEVPKENGFLKVFEEVMITKVNNYWMMNSEEIMDLPASLFEDFPKKILTIVWLAMGVLASLKLVASFTIGRIFLKKNPKGCPINAFACRLP